VLEYYIVLVNLQSFLYGIHITHRQTEHYLLVTIYKDAMKYTCL